MLSRWKFRVVLGNPSKRFRCSDVLRDDQSSETDDGPGNPQVRVRFAPSPTGYLHMGGLRTVVYNHLFTRAHRGVMVLRIEDTDQKRLVGDALDRLLTTLSWLGLTPGEGVGASATPACPPAVGAPAAGVDGPFGPYVQSQRLPLYGRLARSLLDRGAAYPCFCSVDRLMMLRNEALKNRQPVKYDSKCRHLTAAQAQERIADGQPYVVRFKIESEKAKFSDLVFGECEHDLATEGDFVLMKADGFPTYHFANVCDDHSMRISHVLRGEEWLVSTPKHVALYDAFGWTPPLFAHMPLILNVDGGKLSKRDNATYVEHYRNAGYYPLALINSVCSTGGGFKDKNKDKMYEMEELIEKFDVKHISRQPTRFEPLWLDRYNKQYINDKLDTKALVGQMKDLVRGKYGLAAENARPTPDYLNVLDDKYVETCLDYGKNRIATLNQMMESDLACLWSVPDTSLECFLRRAGPDFGTAVRMLTVVENTVRPGSNCIQKFSRQYISQYLRNLAKLNDWRHPFLMQVLRAAICGCDVGPPVAEIFELLGQDVVVKRLRYVLENVQKLKCVDGEAVEVEQ